MGDLVAGIFDLFDDSEGAALSAQEQQYKDSKALQESMYNKAESNYSPYTQAGKDSLATLLSLMGIGSSSDGDKALYNLEKSPTYQFGLQQGNKSLNSRLANSGLYNSGAAIKAASKYNTDYASSQTNQLVSNLMNLSGMGQSATNSLSQIGQGYANGVSNLNTEWGDDQAAYNYEKGNDRAELAGNIGDYALDYYTGSSSNSRNRRYNDYYNDYYNDKKSQRNY